MKKINLVALNAKFIHSSPAVVSISKMYSAYSKRFSINMPELTVTQTTINDSFDSITYNVLNGADIFAFSVYIWNVSLVERICRHIRLANPESIIILGGPEVSYGTDIPDECYDYIISGEGERCFFALICELFGADTPVEWGYSAQGKIRRCDNIFDMDEIDFLYDNIDDFNGRIIYYESSRGCPYSCAYCLSSVCGKVRELPLERILRELDFFIEHKIPQVKFVDRTFNCNRKRAREIWKHIIEAEACVTNFHFEIGADLLTTEDIELLKKCPAGRIQFEAGIQSTYEPALEECCRHTDIQALFNNLKKLINNGNINVHIDLIAGLPYESLDIFKKSFNDAYSVNAHQLQLGFLKLLHGAPLNGKIDKHSYVFSSLSPYEIIKNNVMSNDEIMYLKRVEDVLERYYNSNRFRRSLKLILPLFSTPFDMFSFLADEFEKRKLTFRPVSTKSLYDVLCDLFKDKIDRIEETLLLDFYTSEKSEIVPSTLRELAAVKDKSGRLVKESSQHGNKKAQVKFIGTDAYIIDYSAVDPVTGTYNVSEVIENVQL